MGIRVILADDHGIIRDGLRALLQGHHEAEVVAEADNGRTAIELVRKHAPDVVIMDVSMPDMNGIEATRRIRADVPDTHIIALSMHADKRFVTEMLRAGASGYLLKDGAFEELHHAIQAVLSGQIYLSPRITGVVVEDYVRQLTPGELAFSSGLSDRVDLELVWCDSRDEVHVSWFGVPVEITRPLLCETSPRDHCPTACFMDS